MTLERAVVHGLIASLVQTRNMFSAEVTPTGGDTPQILWDAYMSSILTPLTQLTHINVYWHQYELQRLTNGHWEAYDLINIGLQGLVAGDQLPNQVALVLLGTASGLRHVGRKFIGALSESSQAAGVVIAPYAALAAQALIAYITPFTGIGGGVITPGVISAAGVFHPFVGGTVSSVLGSMRRRKPGAGI